MCLFVSSFYKPQKNPQGIRTVLAHLWIYSVTLRQIVKPSHFFFPPLKYRFGPSRLLKDCVSQMRSLFFKILLTDFRKRARRERKTPVPLIYAFSGCYACMCPAQGLNPQPWHGCMTLWPTELPGPGSQVGPLSGSKEVISGNKVEMLLLRRLLFLGFFLPALLHLYAREEWWFDTCPPQPLPTLFKLSSSTFSSHEFHIIVWHCIGCHQDRAREVRVGVNEVCWWRIGENAA